MTQDEFNEILDRYLAGNCSEEEKQIIHKFYERLQLTDVDWKEKSERERSIIKMELLNNVFNETSVKSTTVLLKNYKRSLYYGLVASVVILCVVALSFNKSIIPSHDPGFITQSTDQSHRATITLIDGSSVTLNANSKLSYPERFNDTARVVKLQGEAFFEVTKDTFKPFIVQSGNIETTVLGTSFNVNAYSKNQIKVTVATGKVMVNTKDQMDYDQQMLLPEQQVVWQTNKSKLSKSTVDLQHVLAWKQNMIFLDRTPLTDAAQMIEQWYNVEIIFENERIKDCLLSGKYKTDNLINILENLKFTMGIEYRVKDNKVFITGNSCK